MQSSMHVQGGRRRRRLAGWRLRMGLALCSRVAIHRLCS